VEVFKVTEQLTELNVITIDEVDIFGNYLEDEALNWFLTNLTSYLTYEDAKQNLTDQFSERIIYPLGQAMKVKYDPEKGIKGYFDAIRRYGTLANLKQNEVSDLNLN